ncbi:MAG: ATP-binding cassette domain-containing protein [Paludibacteraceae bacterium]|nr:ATP-binding cassette domain-containing protein [Paludibacteraceae bacterium]
MNLIIENLTKTFRGKKALDIERYIVHSGEVVGLVGNNGAGKTTLFRIVLDLLKADSGYVKIGGEIAGRPFSCDTSRSEDWKSYTGAFIDTGFLIDYLTPEEYFRFLAKITGIGDRSLAERLAHFECFMNGEIIGRKTLIRNLSMGNKQKVGIIGAMLHYPQLLILDEPFNFLDPTSQLTMKYLLESYAKEQRATIIVSSHNLIHTLDICNRITLLEQGRIIKDYDRDYALLTSEIEAYFRGNVNI